ncbi:hypothetical protein GCM10027570_48280 [Streptomonospora sediminis]
MADSSPARVPPSPGRGAAATAVLRAAALLGATVAIAAGTPVMLVLPGTALLFLAADGAVRFAAAGTAAYRCRPDPGSELRTALQGLEPRAVRRRAAAVEDFLAAASPHLVQREQDVVLDELAEIAGRLPARALRMLAAAPQPFTAAGIAPVLRSWACGTGAGDASDSSGAAASDGFDGAWEALRALSGGAAPAHGHLATALAAIPPDRISARFRRRAAMGVFGDIDADTGAHPYPGAAAWRLLETLAPDGAPTTPGDWWCALAETADDRGHTGEARNRLRRALRAGCDTAAPRLAHHLAHAGHRALTSGDPRTAAAYLAEAVQLEDALDYRLLLRLARETYGAQPGRPEPGGADPDTAADTLEPWPGEVWLTAALLRLGRGDLPAATELLDGAQSRLRPADPQPAAAARLIRAVLTGDNARLAAGARELVAAHGPGWAERIPFGPATVLSRLVNDPAALSADPALPADLLNGLDDRAHAGELAAIRTVAAHRLLGAAALAADDNRFGDAQDRLHGTERLLGPIPAAPAGAHPVIRTAQATARR